MGCGAVLIIAGLFPRASFSDGANSASAAESNTAIPPRLDDTGPRTLISARSLAAGIPIRPLFVSSSTPDPGGSEFDSLLLRSPRFHDTHQGATFAAEGSVPVNLSDHTATRITDSQSSRPLPFFSATDPSIIAPLLSDSILHHEGQDHSYAHLCGSVSCEFRLEGELGEWGEGEFSLDLTPTSSHESSLLVQSLNGTEDEILFSPLGASNSHCLFHGSLIQRLSIHHRPSESQNASRVAGTAILNLCTGMYGTFNVEGRVFFMEPMRNWTDGGGHLIFPYTNTLDPPDSTPPPIQLQDKKVYFEYEKEWEDVGLRRRRRSAQYSHDYYIEVMVVADEKMAIYHGNLLEGYILTLFSTVASIYRHPTLQADVNIVVVRVHIIRPGDPGPIITDNAQDTLRYFCQWQQALNDPTDGNQGHHDVAILLTRRDICRAPGKCDTLGLAELGTMCTPHRSCAIIEDNGLSAAFTIAHELGHIFNIPHDDEKKCEEWMSLKKLNFHIMAPTLEYNTHPWSWSPCSAAMLHKFLEKKEKSSCLLGRPVKLELTEKMQNRGSPGGEFHVDRQCQFVFGERATICPYMPPCKRLWCATNDDTGHGCKTQHMPWADGTECGYMKWCYRGQCVGMRPNERQAVDGGWGEWKAYGACSRTCGGGVAKAFRDCDNPKPSHGGRYCRGVRIRYKPCSTKECSWDLPGFREVQCAEFQNRDPGIHGIPRNVTWVPKYTGIADKDRCKLYCVVGGTALSYKLREKVIDGTPCGRYTDDICVDGVCQHAGCDHRLFSTRKRDACGVCGGDGTACRRINGSFNERQAYGYNSVIKIPMGATEIDVRQRGWNQRTEDDNYLAMQNQEGKWILNGHFQVSVYLMDIPVRGTVLQYSGSDNIVERINSSSPTREDLYIHVLSVGGLYPPGISYSYVLPNSPNAIQYYSRDFYWAHADRWEPCSSQCQGSQRQVVECVDAIHENPADERKCSGDKKRPPERTRVCNTNCHLNWESERLGSCSVECGSGEQKQRSTCVQRFTDGSGKRVNDNLCDSRTRPPYRVACRVDCAGRQWTYSQWTQCSVSCGGGQQRRSALCRDKDGRMVAEEGCRSLTQEPLQQPCNRFDCPRWSYGPWNPCSHSCDGGTQRRHSFCHDGAGREIDVERCNQDEREDWRRCNQKLCVKWEFGDWEECPATCGEGVVTRRGAWCLRSSGEQVAEEECDEREKIVRKVCPLPTCPKWQLGTWSHCSRTCKDGWMTRNVECVDSASREVDDAYCGKDSRPPTHKTCNLGNCPFWRSYDWSACSVSCGSGRKSRRVECRYGSEVVDGSYCENLEQPVSDDECHLRGCPSWEISPWEACPVTCGEGTQRRRVRCLFPNGGLTEDRDCTSRGKPTETRPCVKAECILEAEYNPPQHQVALSTISVVGERRAWTTEESPVKWIVGAWTQCSSSCGNGKRMRQVVCRDVYGRTLEDKYCRLGEKPANTDECINIPCGEWVARPWSPCPETCGEMVLRKREVECVRQTRNERLEPGECNLETKPVGEQLCRVPSCPVHRDHPPSPPPAQWKTGPWQECTNSCGGGWRHRRVECVGEGRCDPNREPMGTQACGEDQCPRWASSAWSQCSKTCGGGMEFRRVFCRAGDGEEERPDSECPAATRPPHRRSCNTLRCRRVIWKSGKWSSCSKTCGRGVRSRSVECVNSETGEEESGCPQETRPVAEHRCRMARCPRWRRTKWSMCSTSCGPGVRSRKVSCYQGRRHEVPASRCAALPKPRESATCRSQACPRYKWATSKWSRCSEKCRSGRQVRDVYCVNEANLRAAPRMCESASKPANVRSCISKNCPYFWALGHWSACSKSCGVGQQTRALHCSLRTNMLVFHENPDPGNYTGPRVPLTLCEGLPRPSDSRECSLGPCDSKFQWTMGPWSHCSATCGFGTQQREVGCLNEEKGKVHGKHCNRGLRPKRRRKCYTRNCQGKDCSEVKQISGSSEDGTYEVLVNGVPLKVYCHLMNASHPQSYIELSNPESTFAEIYGKRLLYPFTCPHFGEREDDCQCTNDGDPEAGKTVFQRLRVDLHNMRLRIDDFTFTRQIFGKRIPLGVAGDCYSAVDCPQGKFSIDLKGTGFRVSQATEWVKRGHRTAMHIRKDGPTVSGKCGGYCGHCYPNKFKGIIVEVDPNQRT